jgi:response regulator RpfG family c-di-GMP phosphodiesterase
MKDNTLPKIKQATDEIWIQVARTLMAIMEQRDELLNLHCVRVANNCANFCERFLSEGWLDRIDKSSIRQMFKEILTNFKAGKIDAPVMPQVVKEVQSMIN